MNPVHGQVPQDDVPHPPGPISPGGSVVSIHIAPAAGSPMETRTSVRAIPGRGLHGDRYATGTGRFSSHRTRGREVTDVTLVATEDLDALGRQFGLMLTPEQTRRNIVTEGVRLGDLIDRRFWIGEVALAGEGFCEPCRLLTASKDPLLLRALQTKGGLRARLLSEGTIAIGHRIHVPRSGWRPGGPHSETPLR